MKKTRRTIPSKRSYSTAVIILIAAAIALFLLKNSILDNKKDSGLEKSPSLTADIKTPAQSPAPPTGTPAADPTQSPETGAPPPATPPPGPEPTPAEEDPCQKTTTDLTQFFAHLEGQEYIKAYALNEPIQTHLTTLVAKILDTPPVNEKETADLLTVLKNASHFFRLLGRKDLSLVKDILTYEQGSVEQRLASLYLWSTLGEECRRNSTLKFQFPLAKSYEYAAFFLNTLGGQSYLARRDATLRVLTKYYCVLIVQQAVQHSLNRYNINLPYHLESVIKDIGNSDFLENQALYLETLKKIKAGL